MNSDGGDDYTDVPADMFAEGETEAVLAPVFVGFRMEAELIRSLLEANDIPAVVFGMGGFTFGAEDAGPNERVMVRSDDLERARATIRDANLGEDGMVEMDEEDAQLIDELHREHEPAPDLDYEDPDASWTDPQDVEVLAGGSDWGPRIVGLIGVAALVIAIIVIVMQAN